MPKADPDQWRSARLEWECTPSMTLTDVAHQLNMKLGSVSEKAKRDGWCKVIPEVREASQIAADALGYISGREVLLAATTTALDLTVATRVAIINKWRDDWAKHRILFTPEACASDPAASKRGKATAELMMVRQRGEAVAYGMSTLTGSDTGAPLVEPEADPDKPKSALDAALEHLLRTGQLPDQPLLEMDDGHDATP
jgi:hypothetical protein